MKDVFSGPHFRDDNEAGGPRGPIVAGRPGLPSLRRNQPRLRYEASRCIPLRREGVSEGFHPDHENGHGA